MIDKCRHSMEHLDHLRGSLLLEPRGHADMYACLLTPPQRVDSDFGTIFLHRSGICPMSAHGIVAAATICIESGITQARSPETLIKFDTPAGLIRAYCSIEENRVRRVFFENVPSYVVARDRQVEVPGLGTVHFDLAYGGEYYAYVEAGKHGLELGPEDLNELTTHATAIASIIEPNHGIVHPGPSALNILSGIVFTETLPRRREVTAQVRQVCVFTDGSVDRSPSGTALSGRLALLHARGEIDMGAPHCAEGLLGGNFTGRIVREGLTVGPYAAILTEIEGTAHLTGYHTFLIGPDDPLKEGFLI